MPYAPPASTSRIRFRWVVTITTGRPTGVAPPARPVPLPRATKGRSWRAATATAAATSVGRRGEAHRGRLAGGDAGVAAVEGELERLGPRPAVCRAPAWRSASSAAIVVDPRSLPTASVRSAPVDRRPDARPEPRVGELRRPGGRGSPLADRRDVPAVVVAVHLRVRLPGRDDRAGARSSSRAAARTARTSRTARTATTSCGSPKQLTDDEVGVPRRGPQEGHLRPGRQGRGGQDRVADPARRRRMHLLEPAGLRGRARLRAAPAHAMRTGVHHSDVKPEVCWQLPLRRIDEEQEDGTVISTLTEFAREGGARVGTTSPGGAPRPPRRSRARSRCTEPGRGAAHDARPKLYRRVVAYLDERSRARPVPVVHPAEVQACWPARSGAANASRLQVEAQEPSSRRADATACTSRSRRIRYSSPRISTSKPASGAKRTRSPSSTLRTVGPTAMTSAQSRRRSMFAVAGITIPARDLRSPASADGLVRSRSAVMRIESLGVVRVGVVHAVARLPPAASWARQGLGLRCQRAIPTGAPCPTSSPSRPVSVAEPWPKQACRAAGTLPGADEAAGRRAAAHHHRPGDDPRRPAACPSAA